MAAILYPPPKWQYIDPNGKPLAFGKLDTFVVGSVTTRKATYQDKAGTIPHSNPVILDANGSTEIYWDGIYNIRLLDQFDAEIYTQDNYTIDVPDNSITTDKIADDAVTSNKIADGAIDLTKIAPDVVNEIGKINVSSNDTTLGFIDTKITTSPEITATIVNPGTNESLNFSITPGSITPAMLQSGIGGFIGLVVINSTQNYTPSASTKKIIVEIVGGGGGAGSTPTNGGTTTFGAYFYATGGIGGGPSNPGIGGVGVNGNLNIPGGTGSNSLYFTGVNYIGTGGDNPLSSISRVGESGHPYGGGSGGVFTGGANAPAGSGAGGYALKFITLPNLTPILVTIGAGAINTQSGANGICIIYEYS